MQGVSYTTGVPAMIGAMMFVKGIWKKPGVWNVEDFDPDPFMEQLNKQGLPWHEGRASSTCCGQCGQQDCKCGR